MRVVHRLITGAVVLTLGLVLGAGPSAASGGSYYQPPAPYSNDYQFDPECPGLQLDVTGHSWGVDSLRNVPGSHGQAFLSKDRYHFQEVWKNLATHKTFRVSGHGVFTERRAVFVPKWKVPADLVPPEGLIGPIYLFTVTDVGQPFIVKQHGQTLYRDQGKLVGKNLFDTLGDHAPGGTSLKFDYVKVIGPHPGLDLDICDLAAQLTGKSTSSG